MESKKQKQNKTHRYRVVVSEVKGLGEWVKWVKGVKRWKLSDKSLI